MTLDEECKGCLYNSQLKKVERSESDKNKIEEFKARVEDSGAAIPGTYLKEISKSALSLFEKSDVIISKGLGNLETLYGEGYDIFYIFMCKCLHIAERFGMAQWQTAFVHECAEN